MINAQVKCIKHQLERRWACCICNTELCNECGASSFEGKVFCTHCSDEGIKKIRKDKEHKELISSGIKVYTKRDYYIGITVLTAFIIWALSGAIWFFYPNEYLFKLFFIPLAFYGLITAISLFLCDLTVPLLPFKLSIYAIKAIIKRR